MSYYLLNKEHKEINLHMCIKYTSVWAHIHTHMHLHIQRLDNH